ncbi:MAG: cupin domain-containing protein [Actinomycetota bacterium]
MAFSGQILDNPITGERILFTRTASDTKGEMLAFELELEPDGHAPGLHVHPIQEERFQVLAGTLEFKKGFRTVIAGEGETVVVPPGVIHRFSNGSDQPARALVEVRPALKMERLLETSTALARERRVMASGMPRPVDLALFMAQFEDEVRAPFVPAGVVRAVMAPLAWAGRKRGLGERYAGWPMRAPQSRRDARRPSDGARRPRAR